MLKKPEKFIKNLSKLDNYYVLREEENLFILGRKLNIKYVKEMKANLFQPQTFYIDTQFTVFFLISTKPLSKKPIGLEKDFVINNLPILILNKAEVAANLDLLEDILDTFVDKTFLK